MAWIIRPWFWVPFSNCSDLVKIRTPMESLTQATPMNWDFEVLCIGWITNCHAMSCVEGDMWHNLKKVESHFSTPSFCCHSHNFLKQSCNTTPTHGMTKQNVSHASMHWDLDAVSWFRRNVGCKCHHFLHLHQNWGVGGIFLRRSSTRSYTQPLTPHLSLKIPL